MPRFPALKYANGRLNSMWARSSTKGPSRGTGEPVTGSMRMTSAPRSANCLPQYCPANPERSRTRSPARADGAPPGIDAEGDQGVANALASARVVVSPIELIPGSAITAAGDTPQRVDDIFVRLENI